MKKSIGTIVGVILVIIILQFVTVDEMIVGVLSGFFWVFEKSVIVIHEIFTFVLGL
ncbi:hypothetical protein KHQ82_03385 [Mycoplasmatota bacterium]|nr:hypothetical protein KHQ82_03385 [Mycoplasmatota bacterium]